MINEDTGSHGIRVASRIDLSTAEVHQRFQLPVLQPAISRCCEHAAAHAGAGGATSCLETNVVVPPVLCKPDPFVDSVGPLLLVTFFVDVHGKESVQQSLRWLFSAFTSPLRQLLWYC